jgi:hypothetical protein
MKFLIEKFYERIQQDSVLEKLQILKTTFCADAHASLKTLWLTLPPFVLERTLGSRAAGSAC